MSQALNGSARHARASRGTGAITALGLALSASTWSVSPAAAAGIGLVAAPPPALAGEASIGALSTVRLAVLRPAMPSEQGSVHLVAKPVPGVPDVLTSARISQLPWRSGVSSRFGADGPDETDFGDWRGRPVDVHVLFSGEHETWEDITDHLTGGWFKTRVQQSPQPVISLPMLPKSEAKQHAKCAAGQFNAIFQEFGRNLIAAGAQNAVVRLGWEANIGSDSHPWGIDTPAEIPNYKRCFAQLVTALRSTARSLKIEWSIGKKFDSKMPALTTYPGNSYVDIWGLHYYDRPPVASQQAWDAEVNSTEGKTRHPVGIGAWLAEAKRNRKRLAVPEWGVWNIDNPLYIELMYKFFKANAGSIAYENYFNLNEKHWIFLPDGVGTTPYPLSATKYKELWSTAP